MVSRVRSNFRFGRSSVTYNKIGEYAANTLGISADEIDRDTTVKSLGLD